MHTLSGRDTTWYPRNLRWASLLLSCAPEGMQMQTWRGFDIKLISQSFYISLWAEDFKPVSFLSQAPVTCKIREFISLGFCSKYGGKLKVIAQWKEWLRNAHSELAECWTELVKVTLSELFGEIHNTRSITWAYYMRQNIINYLRLLGFTKLPVLLGKINFSFVPGNEFPRKQIIPDIDLVIWSIYLTLA